MNKSTDLKAAINEFEEGNRSLGSVIDIAYQDPNLSIDCITEVEGVLNENVICESEGEEITRLGKSPIDKETRIDGKYGHNTYRDNGREWGRRSTDRRESPLPLFDRMQESREIQGSLFDYEPSGGSCESITADSVLENE